MHLIIAGLSQVDLAIKPDDRRRYDRVRLIVDVFFDGPLRGCGQRQGH